MIAKAPVCNFQSGSLVCQDLVLLQCRAVDVNIVGVSSKAAHADHDPLTPKGCSADFAAEFIAHPGLSCENATDRRLVQGVDLVVALGLLVQQLRHKRRLCNDAIPQGAGGHLVEVAARVAYDCARVAFQLFNALRMRLNSLACAHQPTAAPSVGHGGHWTGAVPPRPSAPAPPTDPARAPTGGRRWDGRCSFPLRWYRWRHASRCSGRWYRIFILPGSSGFATIQPFRRRCAYVIGSVRTDRWGPVLKEGLSGEILKSICKTVSCFCKTYSNGICQIAATTRSRPSKPVSQRKT